MLTIICTGRFYVSSEGETLQRVKRAATDGDRIQGTSQGRKARARLTNGDRSLNDQ
jgi:hypothetical protein